MFPLQSYFFTRETPDKVQLFKPWCLCHLRCQRISETVVEVSKSHTGLVRERHFPKQQWETRQGMLEQKWQFLASLPILEFIWSLIVMKPFLTTHQNLLHWWHECGKFQISSPELYCVFIHHICLRVCGYTILGLQSGYGWGEIHKWTLPSS